MIEFKVIASPDKSQQATYQHLGSELIFGQSEGEMIIDDPAFGPTQLKVKIDGEGKASIENLNTNIEVRLNGKAITGEMPLKEKDNVTVARTTINFARLDGGPPPLPEAYENPLVKDRVVPGSKERALLDALEFLEKRAPESGATPLSENTAGGPVIPPPVPLNGMPPLPPPLPAGAPKPPLPPLPKKS
ncbi:MAG TPA: hypothetical protein VIH99_01400 [Bdellovibrionota bacterium]|jgi:hypothetical protein